MSMRSFLSQLIPNSDLEQFDLDAINGRNLDLPRFKDHDAVISLCRHFVGVYRKRTDGKSLTIERDENGEDIWIVAGEEMPRSAMLELAREYAPLPGRFAR